MGATTLERSVTVSSASSHPTMLGSTTVTTPVVVTATGGKWHLVATPTYHYAVAAATYTTITTFVTALNAATPQTGAPPLATVVVFAKTGSKVKATFAAGNLYNGQTFSGTVLVTQAHLGGTASGGTTGTTLLWKTTTGVTPEDAAVAPGNGHPRAGTFNQPLGVVVVNNGTHTVYLGGESTITTGIGTPLAKGASIGFSLVGGDTKYAVSATTVNVRVSFTSNGL